MCGCWGKNKGQFETTIGNYRLLSLHIPPTIGGMETNTENPNADELIIKATSDLFIATLFSAPKNEPILCDLINAVLENSGGTLIKTATVLNPFNVKEYVLGKQIVLDVRVGDEFGRFYNIEIQTTPHAAFAERVVYGWADTFAAQLHAGDKYKKLNPVFCIIITEFNFLPEAEGVHLVFELRELSNPNILLSNCLQIHVLRLHDLLRGRRDVLTGVSPKLQRWASFFAFGGKVEEEKMSVLVENDPLIMGAVGELQHFAMDPKQRELERSHKLWMLDYYSGLEAALEEGIAKGRAEDKAEMILRTLSRKGELPPQVCSKINSITDITKLDRLIDVALDCGSLDEFAKNLE